MSYYYDKTWFWTQEPFETVLGTSRDPWTAHFGDYWLKFFDSDILEVYLREAILITIKNKPKCSSTFGSQKWTLSSQENTVHHHLKWQVHVVDYGMKKDN